MSIKDINGKLLFADKSKESKRVVLEKAVKQGADLRGANLRGANLRGANLRGANLGGAYLGGANLEVADLRGAYLEGANLRGANLREANLGGAYLRVANLRGANLYRAYLGGANLRGANLGGANLYRANLGGANLRGAYLPHFQICPEEGGFYAWKKFRRGIVGKIYIPAKAKRTSSLIGRKCRASEAKLISLSNDTNYCTSWNGATKYKVGEKMIPDRYDDDIRVECTNGIHFFMTKREAIEW